MLELKRNCPRCNKEMFYKNNYYYIQSIKLKGKDVYITKGGIRVHIMNEDEIRIMAPDILKYYYKQGE